MQRGSDDDNSDEYDSEPARVRKCERDELERQGELSGKGCANFPSAKLAPSQQQHFKVARLDGGPPIDHHRMDTDGESSHAKAEEKDNQKDSRAALDAILAEFRQDALDAVADANEMFRYNLDDKLESTPKNMTKLFKPVSTSSTRTFSDSKTASPSWRQKTTSFGNA